MVQPYFLNKENHPFSLKHRYMLLEKDQVLSKEQVNVAIFITDEILCLGGYRNIYLYNLETR
jgi:hypothetical protein